MLLTAYRGMAFILWPAGVGLACIAQEAGRMPGWASNCWRRGNDLRSRSLLRIRDFKERFNWSGSVYLAAGPRSTRSCGFRICRSLAVVWRRPEATAATAPAAR